MLWRLAWAGTPAWHRALGFPLPTWRGVKGIGATSHYVTKQWDEVAMIKQDVARPSHRVRVQDLVRKERDLERIVLWRAMRWRLEHRILSYGNRTVILN